MQQGCKNYFIIFVETYLLSDAMKVCMQQFLQKDYQITSLKKHTEKPFALYYPMGLDFANETQHNLWQTVLPPNH